MAQTLSNAVQLSAQKGLLTADMDAELDRLYRDHVEPPQYSRMFEDLATRNAIRTRANQVFRSTGHLAAPRAPHPRVAEFHFRRRSPADRLYLPAQRHARLRAGIPLGRDPGQAKMLAFHRRRDSRQDSKKRVHSSNRSGAAPAGESAASVCHRTARRARHSRGTLARLGEWLFSCGRRSGRQQQSSNCGNRAQIRRRWSFTQRFT